MKARMQHLLTVESVNNVAYRDATARAVTTRLEKVHAGFRVMSGPYAVTVRDALQCQAEKAACVRAMRDQQRAGCEVKIIMVGAVAYVLRSVAGWVNGAGPEAILPPGREAW